MSSIYEQNEWDEDVDSRQEDASTSSSKLVQDYEASINQAMMDDSFQVVTPWEDVSEAAEVTQLDWDVSEKNSLKNVPDNVTHVYVRGDLPRGAEIDFQSDKSRKIDFLQSSKSPLTVLLEGHIGGSFVNEGSANMLHLVGTDGDWSIELHSGKPISDDHLIDDDLGLDTAFSQVMKVGGNYLSTSSGTNHVTVSGAQNLIGLGGGHNYIVSEGQDTVVGSGIVFNHFNEKTETDGVFARGDRYGTDHVTIKGGAGSYELGSNATVVDAAKVGSVIKVRAESSISGGAGSSVTFDNAGGSGSISDAVGDTISAAGNLVVSGGRDQVISVAGSLNFMRGTGMTQVTAGGDSVIFGADGLNVAGTMGGHTIFTANQPGSTGDQIYDASASTGDLEFWSGPGTSSFIGGSGNNHLVFGTKFEGTSGESFATVTGGSNANSFGVLAGHSGGQITITDFNASKGDFFFEYLYKPENAAQAVNDLLATATVKDGNTTLQLDNNMQVTFLGVTNLDANAIRIS